MDHLQLSLSSGVLELVVKNDRGPKAEQPLKLKANSYNTLGMWNECS